MGDTQKCIKLSHDTEQVLWAGKSLKMMLKFEFTRRIWQTSVVNGEKIICKGWLVLV